MVGREGRSGETLDLRSELTTWISDHISNLGNLRSQIRSQTLDIRSELKPCISDQISNSALSMQGKGHGVRGPKASMAASGARGSGGAAAASEGRQRLTKRPAVAARKAKASKKVIALFNASSW